MDLLQPLSQDVKSLKFTRNPAEPPQSDADNGRRHAKFICPLTLREMSGQVPFVYIIPCGDVFSAVGLRTLSTSTDSSSTPSPPRSEAGAESSNTPPLDICPQCGASFDKKKDVRTINPSAEEALKMMEAMMTNRAAAKAAKSSKKRKAAETSYEANSAVATNGGEVAKRSKKTDTNESNASPAPGANPSFAAVTKKVAQELAEEEKRRKSTMSSAVASLYQSKKDPKLPKDTFLTMNTFTRVSLMYFPTHRVLRLMISLPVCIILPDTFFVCSIGKIIYGYNRSRRLAVGGGIWGARWDTMCHLSHIIHIITLLLPPVDT